MTRIYTIMKRREYKRYIIYSISNLILYEIVTLLCLDSSLYKLLFFALYIVACTLFRVVKYCPLQILASSSSITEFYRKCRYLYRGKYLITTLVYGGYITTALTIIIIRVYGL